MKGWEGGSKREGVGGGEEGGGGRGEVAAGRNEEKGAREGGGKGEREGGKGVVVPALVGVLTMQPSLQNLPRNDSESTRIDA